MKKVGYLGVVAVTVMLTAGAVRDADMVGASTGTSSLTIYNSNVALVRREVERLLPAGMHTVRVEGLPTNIDPSSLIVLDEGVTLLGVRGFRSYQDASTGPGASLDLDLGFSHERTQLVRDLFGDRCPRRRYSTGRWLRDAGQRLGHWLRGY
jgi:hypothetical protein